MNNEMRAHTPGGSRPSQATQTLGRSVGGAVDSAMDAMDGAVDRGKAMVRTLEQPPAIWPNLQLNK